MDFVDLIEAVRDGLTQLMNCTNDGEKLNQDFCDWSARGPRGGYRELTENIFNTAIIAGLLKTQAKNKKIKKIGCAREPNHSTFSNYQDVTFVSSFKTSASRKLFAKDPDIVFTDEKGNASEDFYPNWIIQVKKKVDSHPKASEAMGDYLWGYIDKKYLEVVDKRKLNVAMVWFERDEDRRKDRWLHADVKEFKKGNNGQINKMTLKFSPGYHKHLRLPFVTNNIGEMKYINSRGGPWIDMKKCIITPNNKTVIKQMLGTGTNSSYVRMFTQPGVLEISSEFVQFKVKNMWCYIHRLNEKYSLKNVNHQDLTQLTPSLINNEPIFRWIP